jgi:hypothetical protein
VRLIARLECWIFGHKRGRRVAEASDTVRIVLACGRCGKQWTRKARKLLS